MQAPILQVKRLSARAKLPTRANAFAAGYDLFSAYTYIIPAGSTILVDTEIAVAIPVGTCGRIVGRSGLALRSSIAVLGGVIDQDYHGSIGVILCNHAETAFRIGNGDHIAQLILERIMTPEIVEVKDFVPQQNSESK